MLFFVQQCHQPRSSRLSSWTYTIFLIYVHDVDQVYCYALPNVPRIIATVTVFIKSVKMLGK